MSKRRRPGGGACRCSRLLSQWCCLQPQTGRFYTHRGLSSSGSAHGGSSVRRLQYPLELPVQLTGQGGSSTHLHPLTDPSGVCQGFLRDYSWAGRVLFWGGNSLQIITFSEFLHPNGWTEMIRCVINDYIPKLTFHCLYYVFLSLLSWINSTDAANICLWCPNITFNVHDGEGKVR